MGDAFGGGDKLRGRVDALACAASARLSSSVGDGGASAGLGDDCSTLLGDEPGLVDRSIVGYCSSC